MKDWRYRAEIVIGFLAWAFCETKPSWTLVYTSIKEKYGKGG